VLQAYLAGLQGLTIAKERDHRSSRAAASNRSATNMR
jgi:hypothetical protein